MRIYSAAERSRVGRLSNMELIMENWRHFINNDEVDIVKLNEEYKAFYNAYDKYCLLNEGAQRIFLVQEAAMARIIEFFKKLGEGIGTQWQKLVAIFKAEDGILWKVMKLIGWSLDNLAEILHAGFKTLNLIQDVIIDLVKENPISGQAGEKVTQWITNKLFEDKDLANMSKFAIAGTLLAIFIVSVFLGNGSPPFQAGLILAALAGKYAARDLFTESFFAKIILSLASGVALNALFPGFGIIGGPIIAIMKKIISMYRVGKFGVGLAKKITRDDEEGVTSAESEPLAAASK